MELLKCIAVISATFGTWIMYRGIYNYWKTGNEMALGMPTIVFSGCSIISICAILPVLDYNEKSEMAGFMAKTIANEIKNKLT